MDISNISACIMFTFLYLFYLNVRGVVVEGKGRERERNFQSAGLPVKSVQQPGEGRLKSRAWNSIWVFHVCGRDSRIQ